MKDTKNTLIYYGKLPKIKVRLPISKSQLSTDLAINPIKRDFKP